MYLSIILHHPHRHHPPPSTPPPPTPPPSSTIHTATTHTTTILHHPHHHHPPPSSSIHTTTIHTANTIYTTTTIQHHLHHYHHSYHHHSPPFTPPPPPQTVQSLGRCGDICFLPRERGIIQLCLLSLCPYGSLQVPPIHLQIHFPFIPKFTLQFISHSSPNSPSNSLPIPLPFHSYFTPILLHLLRFPHSTSTLQFTASNLFHQHQPKPHPDKPPSKYPPITTFIIKPPFLKYPPPSSPIKPPYQPTPNKPPYQPTPNKPPYQPTPKTPQTPQRPFGSTDGVGGHTGQHLREFSSSDRRRPRSQAGLRPQELHLPRNVRHLWTQC